MVMDRLFTIGKLAEKAAVGVETVRFYQRKGLLKTPTKTGAFRKYPLTDIARIRFIKRAQELGFTLKEVKELMDLDRNSGRTCRTVAEKAVGKIAEIECKIADLQKMKGSLEELTRSCKKSSAGLKVSDCFAGNC